MSRRFRVPFLLFALTAACGGNAVSPSPAASPAREPAPAARAASARPKSQAVEAARPSEVVDDADAVYRSGLGVSARDDRFSVDRQVAELERAILLYEQFIERAGDAPEYAEAVRRSRERIADMRDTLPFLIEEKGRR